MKQDTEAVRSVEQISAQVRTEVKLTHTTMPTPATAQLETDSIESNAPVQTQSRIQPVTTTTTTPATFDSTAPVPTPAPTPSSTPAPIPTPISNAAQPPAPAPTTTMYLSTAVTTGTMTVVKVTTVNPHETMQHNDERSEESEREISEEWNVEESVEKGEPETERRIDEEKAVKNDDTRTMCTRTDKANVTRHQSVAFDWATNIDESPGPVPTFVDRGLAKYIDYIPITPLLPVHAPFEPTVTPSKGDVAPHTRTPALPTDPTAPRAHTSTMHAPTNCIPTVHMPATPALVNPDPSDATPNTPMPTNFDGTLVKCTTCTHIASANPTPITVFTGTSPIAPAASAPSIVHGPCDFSALCSGTRNPWGSLNHRRHRPNSPTRYTNSHLKHSNLCPLHPPHPISPLLHSFNSQSNSNSYSQSRRLEPFRLAESHISLPVNFFKSFNIHAVFHLQNRKSPKIFQSAQNHHQNFENICTQLIVPAVILYHLMDRIKIDGCLWI